MDLKTSLEINNNLIEFYSEYLSEDPNVIYLNASNYQHLVKMLVSEIDGNRKAVESCDNDIAYKEFAENNIIELTGYLSWITFLSATNPDKTKFEISIPQGMGEKLFLHLLSYDTGSTYVI